MINVGPSLNQPKSRERQGFKKGGREKEPTMLWKKLNKEMRDGQDGEP